jgi:S1-C subfamily serine protease
MEPRRNASFRRWNIVIISILAALVLGVFIAAVVPRLEGNTSAARQIAAEAHASALRGVQVENLTPAIARQLGIPATAFGAVVTSVDPSSAAAAAHLERGDVIHEVNRRPVRDVADYDRVLAGTDHQTIFLLVNRAGWTRFIVVSPQ